jgi:LysR family transcriptional regulator, glycine cleavage system transcriptional activator
LIPRLHSFKEQNPSLDIIISSNIGNNGNYGDQLNLDSDDYDIAISNYQDPTTIEQPVIFLRKEYLAPVYSMLLVKGDTQLTIDELLTYPRLHPTKDRSDWRAWFAQTGIQQPLGNTELTFDTLDMALTSCLSGQGATITDLLFVTNELKQGFLKLNNYLALLTNITGTRPISDIVTYKATVTLIKTTNKKDATVNNSKRLSLLQITLI